jgi:hypothetical protein
MIQYAATNCIDPPNRRLLDAPPARGMTINATIPALRRLSYCCRAFLDSDNISNVSQAEGFAAAEHLRL